MIRRRVTEYTLNSDRLDARDPPCHRAVTPLSYPGQSIPPIALACMIPETVSKTGLYAVTSAASDVALYGADPTPRLVAVHPIGLDQSTPARVVLYTRSTDGQRVETEEAPLYPFFFVSDIGLLAGFPEARYRSQPL